MFTRIKSALTRKNLIEPEHLGAGDRIKLRDGTVITVKTVVSKARDLVTVGTETGQQVQLPTNQAVELLTDPDLSIGTPEAWGEIGKP